MHFLFSAEGSLVRCSRQATNPTCLGTYGTVKLEFVNPAKRWAPSRPRNAAVFTNCIGCTLQTCSPCQAMSPLALAKCYSV